jgi:hypothetical protein
MTTVKDIGNAAQRLLDDETFQSVLDEIRKDQVAVFLDTAATREAREDAHVIVRALDKFEGCIRRRIANASFERKKEGSAP